MEGPKTSRKKESLHIAIIGLGYVGLPLAVEFGKKFQTTGYDISSSRIKELKEGEDSTLEVSKKNLHQPNLRYTDKPDELKECNIFIITVPTPIDEDKNPDLTYLISASKLVGKCLNQDDIVIYESTVFPGATEEICVPLLEEESKLTFNQGFFCGYSPERINPGDGSHKLPDIVKVTSGSNKTTAIFIDQLYGNIIKAGTYMAESIKIAEAAKIIENTQRDVNIALVNELTMLFNALNIDTQKVLSAAKTKWNFLDFYPGLVGGHCIGVDPYYLTHKAEQEGYIPEMILSGRKINDGMAFYVSNNILELLEKEKINTNKANLLLLGFSFKENCPDYRNTKVLDLKNELSKNLKVVDIYDPWIDKHKVLKELRIDLIEKPKKNFYDVIVVAVGHKIFKEMSTNGFSEYAKEKYVLYNIQNSFPILNVTGRL